ncbi:glycosyltransferase family 2 protein [Streptococcus sp. 20-1249]|uniref:glycosyltransferase family 2 protein n=1 Tax=Streptococcus hepaticus TaxID=3349163 RepID=UPI00374A652C
MFSLEEKVSIIIPVYNVEKYLERCLTSVINQTYQHLEIILINDGSTDQSGKICNEFAQHDNRIKVINKDNGGLSSARNAGLAIYSGKYITFIDSDDWVSPDYIEYMLSYMYSEKVDLVQCNFVPITDEGVFLKKVRIKKNDIEYLTSKDKILDAFFKTQSFNTMAWGKLYSATFIRNMYFLEGHNNEDTIFAADYINKLQNIVILPEIKYYYLLNTTSIMNSRLSSKKVEDAYYSANYMMKVCDKSFPSYTIYMHKNIYLFSMRLLNDAKKIKKKDFIQSIRKNLQASRKVVFLNLFSYSFKDILRIVITTLKGIL